MPWFLVLGGGGLGLLLVQLLRGRQAPNQTMTAVRRRQFAPGMTPNEAVEDTSGEFIYAPRPIPGTGAEPTSAVGRGRAKSATTGVTTTVTASKVAPKPSPKPAPVIRKTVAKTTTTTTTAAAPKPRPVARPVTSTRTPGTAAIKGRTVRVPTHSRYGAIYRAVVTPRIRPWKPPAKNRPGGGGGSKII